MLVTQSRLGSWLFAFVVCFTAQVSPAQPPSGWDFQTSLAIRHQFAAETSDGRAEQERTSMALSTGIVTELAKGQLRGAIGYVWGDDDWAGDYFTAGGPFNEADWVGGSPYDGVETFSVGLDYTRSVRGPWGLFVRGRTEWAVARFDGARESAELGWSDGASASLAVGGSYRFSEDFSISTGLFYADRLGDDPLVFPIIFVRWQIDDNWSFYTADGVFLTYDVSANRQHLFTASLTYESSDFAHSRAAVIHTGTGASETTHVYAEEEGVRAELSYLLNLSRRWGIRSSLAYDFARQIEFRAWERQIEKSDMDAAFSVAVTLIGRF